MNWGSTRKATSQRTSSDCSKLYKTSNSWKGNSKPFGSTTPNLKIDPMKRPLLISNMKLRTCQNSSQSFHISQRSMIIGTLGRLLRSIKRRMIAVVIIIIIIKNKKMSESMKDNTGEEP